MRRRGAQCIICLHPFSLLFLLLLLLFLPLLLLLNLYSFLKFLKFYILHPSYCTVYPMPFFKRYVLLDSWWYYKGKDGGVKEWIGRPDIFPHGNNTSKRL